MCNARTHARTHALPFAACARQYTRHAHCLSSALQAARRAAANLHARTAQAAAQLDRLFCPAGIGTATRHIPRHALHNALYHALHGVASPSIRLAACSIPQHYSSLLVSERVEADALPVDNFYRDEMVNHHSARYTPLDAHATYHMPLTCGAFSACHTPLGQLGHTMHTRHAHTPCTRHAHAMHTPYTHTMHSPLCMHTPCTHHCTRHCTRHSTHRACRSPAARRTCSTGTSRPLAWRSSPSGFTAATRPAVASSSPKTAFRCARTAPSRRDATHVRCATHHVTRSALTVYVMMRAPRQARHDAPRTCYIKQYLQALARAMRDGVDVRA